MFRGRAIRESLVCHFDVSLKCNLKSKGNTPVAMFTGNYSGFNIDATAIDRASLRFAGAADLGIGKPPEDVDGDGDMDMVFHFDTEMLQLPLSATSATLIGRTSGNIYFEGSDSVRVVPAK